MKLLICFLITIPFLVEGSLIFPQRNGDHISPNLLKEHIEQVITKEINELTDCKSNEILDDETNTCVKKHVKPLPVELSEETTEPDSSRSKEEVVPPHPVEPNDCASNKSLISKHDMKGLIARDERDILRELRENFHSLAEEVHKKHNQSVEEFLEFFRDRPEHLKHVLESVAETRQTLEPYVKDIADKLEQYPALEASYNSKVEQVNTLLKKLANYKHICALNCGEKPITFPVIMGNADKTKNEGPFCANVNDVFKIINSSIQQQIPVFKDIFLNKIKSDDEEYGNKIQIFKNQLKDMALKDFGRTMYDILNLQDEYHHFGELVKTSTGFGMSEIRQNMAYVDLKLMELENEIEKVRKYCLNCHNNNIIMMYNINRRSYASKNTDEETTYAVKIVIDELVKESLDDFMQEVQNYHNAIFEKLDQTLNNPKSVDDHIEHLKPIQNEVAILTNEEIENFNKLKSMASKSNIQNIHDLLEKTKNMLDNLQKIQDGMKTLT